MATMPDFGFDGVSSSFYGETRMTKISSRPASLCYLNESATLDVNYSPSKNPKKYYYN